jgi:hypothetical protein
MLALFLFVDRSSDIVRHQHAVKSVGIQGWVSMLFLFVDNSFDIVRHQQRSFTVGSTVG